MLYTGGDIPQAIRVIQPFNEAGFLTELRAIDTGFGATTYTANLICHVPITIAAPFTVSYFWVDNGSATVSGNVDMGVYSFDGQTKIVSTGSTANTTNFQAIDVTDTVLAPGRYWLSYGSDTASNVNRANAAVQHWDAVGLRQHASGWSSGLPSTATFNIPTVAICPVFGAAEGTL